MLVFMTNKAPFSAIFQVFFKYFSFLKLGKGAISEVSTINRIIWETNLINTWILAD